VAFGDSASLAIRTSKPDPRCAAAATGNRRLPARRQRISKTVRFHPARRITTLTLRSFSSSTGIIAGSCWDCAWAPEGEGDSTANFAALQKKFLTRHFLKGIVASVYCNAPI
jgi:hypothetical protein